MGVGGRGERGETTQLHTLKLKHTLVYICQSVQFACTPSALHPSSISMKLCICATLHWAFLYMYTVCLHMHGVQYNQDYPLPRLKMYGCNNTAAGTRTLHHKWPTRHNSRGVLAWEWKREAEARWRRRGREQWQICPQSSGTAGGRGPCHLTVNWTMNILKWHGTQRVE